MSKARELAELGAVYDSGALSNRNMVINGAMQIAQRGTSECWFSATSEFVDVIVFHLTSTSGRGLRHRNYYRPPGFSNS